VIPERRSTLTRRPNPDPRHDYVVELAAVAPDGLRVRVRYIPDREVLEADGLARRLRVTTGSSPELTALDLIDDLLNELLPRWVEVGVERDGPPGERVIVEERRPDWDNPELTRRLGEVGSLFRNGIPFPRETG